MTNYHYVLACMYAARAKGFDIAPRTYYVERSAAEAAGMAQTKGRCCAVGAVMLAEGMPEFSTGNRIKNALTLLRAMLLRPGMEMVAKGFDSDTRIPPVFDKDPETSGFAVGVEMRKAAERRGWIKA